jgi:hypothetical protein
MAGHMLNPRIEQVRNSERLSLVCASTPSNPPAALLWRLHMAGHMLNPRIEQVRNSERLSLVCESTPSYALVEATHGRAHAQPRLRTDEEQ